MASLLYLRPGDQLAISDSAMAPTLREILINQPITRKYIITGQGGSAIAAEQDNAGLAEIDSIAMHGANYLALHYISDHNPGIVPSSATQSIIPGTLVRSSTNLKIDVNSLGSDYVAELAYGDPARKTFASIFEFAKRITLSFDLSDAISSTGIFAIYLDQINETFGILPLGWVDQNNIGLTQVCAASWNDYDENQYGE